MPQKDHPLRKQGSRDQTSEKQKFKMLDTEDVPRILCMAQPLSEHQSPQAMLDQSRDQHELIGRIEEYCKHALIDISNTQIRNIFELILQTVYHPARLPFIRPRIAYYAAKVETGEGGHRGNKQRAQEQLGSFANLLDHLIREVKTEGQLESLRLFLEAVVAYHRAATESLKRNKQSNRGEQKLRKGKNTHQRTERKHGKQ